jgi:hypothetical protein
MALQQDNGAARLHTQYNLNLFCKFSTSSYCSPNVCEVSRLAAVSLITPLSLTCMQAPPDMLQQLH